MGDKLFEKVFEIHMANNEVLHLTRKWYDFWLFDLTGFMMYHKGDKKVRVNKHFTLYVEEED